MDALILHRKEFGKMCLAPNSFSLEDYDIAANYNADIDSVTDFLEMAYEATNSIDYHWSENEGIAVSGDYSKRSTSVGDIVWLEKDGHGEIWEVRPMGFKLIHFVGA